MKRNGRGPLAGDGNEEGEQQLTAKELALMRNRRNQQAYWQRKDARIKELEAKVTELQSRTILTSRSLDATLGSAKGLLSVPRGDCLSTETISGDTSSCECGPGACYCSQNGTHELVQNLTARITALEMENAALENRLKFISHRDVSWSWLSSSSINLNDSIGSGSMENDDLDYEDYLIFKSSSDEQDSDTPAATLKVDVTEFSLQLKSLKYSKIMEEEIEALSTAVTNLAHIKGRKKAVAGLMEIMNFKRVLVNSSRKEDLAKMGLIFHMFYLNHRDLMKRLNEVAFPKEEPTNLISDMNLNTRDAWPHSELVSRIKSKTTIETGPVTSLIEKIESTMNVMCCISDTNDTNLAAHYGEIDELTDQLLDFFVSNDEREMILLLPILCLRTAE